MVKKQKFLKNLLTSVSVASVVASIGGSSVAFGDFDPTNAGNMDIQLTADLANAGGSAIFNANNLTLRVVDTSPNELEGIIVKGAGANAIIDNDISIGTITTNKNVMDVIINTSKTLTLSGDEHTGLGITTLANAGSTLKLEANATINNAVTTAVDGQGILTFEGVGTANGAIGANAAALAEVNIGNGAVTLNENVFAANIKFEHVNSVINLKDGKKIKGNIITTDVNQGKLNFLGGGEVDGNIGTKDAALNVISLQAGDVILKGDVFTQYLKYYNATGTADNKTVTIAGNFGDNDYTGKVDFSPNKANILTFKGAIRAEPYTFNSEIENGNNGTLNVQANLRATHADIGKINTINIGIANHNRTLIIDVSKNNITLLDEGATINFKHAQSVLELYSNAADNKTITLANSLDPGANSDKGQGIVQLKSAHVDKTLRIACKGAKTLGTKANYLKKLTLSGAGKLAIEPAIYAKIITLSTDSEITTNDVNGSVIFANAATLIVAPAHSITGDVTFGANGGTLIGTVAGDVVIRNGGDGTVGGVISNNVTFNGDGKLTANGSIQGDVYFHYNKGAITLADKQKIGRIIKDGENATVEFLGDGEVGGAIDGLKLLKAGAGNVNLAAGNHSITEIQGNGKNSLTFATGFNLAGGINLTGGQAVGLIFEGNSSISGNVGTNAPVGNIQIQAGTVTFGGLIKANDITIAKEATAKIAKDMAVGEIKGKGKVKFNNEDKIVIDSPVGDDTTMEIAGANVEAIKKVSAANIIFSSNKSATLTLKAASTINNITTTGNNLYSLALAADCSTGISDIGSGTSKLEINLLSDHTITINSKKFYSAVSTEKHNSGKVIFKSDGSVTYGNLGADTLRLSDVTFDNNATVKADIYSKTITINADKTASFAGINKRTIAVPGINIDGVELPRVSKEFSYYTLIDSENIDAKPSSKIKFDNATLVKAPINSGQVILADNVWFKGKVDSTAPVSFANKYIILEKDIKFASIEASQAKIILLPGNQAITGDLAAKDLTIDIGTNQLKYAGNAQLTGTLDLETVYDSSKMAGGNIEIQSKSKLDLSQLDKLNIKVIARSDINKISENTKYILVSSVDKDGITVIDKDKVKLVSVNEQSRFVEWSIDPSTLTLYAKDISKKVLEEELKEAKDRKEEQETQEGEEVKDNSKEELEKKLKESKGKKEEKKIKGKTQEGEEAKEKTKEPRKSDIKLSSEKIAFMEQLIKVSDRKSDAANLISQLGLMDEKNEYLAIDKLLPGNKHLMEQSSMNSTSAVMTLTSQAVANQITARATATIGAGDDDKVMYGVWGSPFYSTANQKMQEGVSGYNMKSSGLIVGFDGLLTDNLLVGGAYSLIDTKMSHKNQKSGDRTNGQTNIFSLYGVYKFAGNWFAESIASYGITQ